MYWERGIQCLRMHGQQRMTQPENKCPEECLLPGSKLGKSGKSVLAYLCFVECCWYVGFFFPHLMHRVWSLMLKETLKYWHQNWLTDVMNWRTTQTGHTVQVAWSSLTGQWVGVQYLFLAKYISCMCTTENKRTYFLPNIMLHKS